MRQRRCAILVVVVIAHACALFGCEIEVPLVDTAVDAGNDGASGDGLPDAFVGDDGGGPDSGSGSDSGLVIPDAATFD